MIRTRKLVRRYGDTVALDGIDLDVPTGSVYGLAGPNGAGKTTLLAILAGLRAATSGSVAIEAPRSRVALLPDTPRFDPWLTGREVVELSLELSGGGRDDGRVDEMLSRTGLADAKKRRVGGYSRGMLQRLGIAATLVGGPRLVLLDEPASALDPQGRREVLDLVRRLRGEATILFSSHILGDVQEVCDTVGVLRDGALVFQGPIEKLLVGDAVPRYEVRLRRGAPHVLEALRREPWVKSARLYEGDEILVEVHSLEDAEVRLSRALADAGAAVVSLRPEEITFERAFLELTS